MLWLMPLTSHQQLLALLSQADQLVTEAEKLMDNAPDADTWVMAEDLREMNVEMRARIETWMDRLADR